MATVYKDLRRPVFKNAQEAEADYDFQDRVGGSVINAVAPHFYVYVIGDYIYDKINQIKYNRRRPLQAPTKLSMSEWGLCWNLILKDVEIRKLKGETL